MNASSPSGERFEFSNVNLARLLLLTTHCYNAFARARVEPGAPSRDAAIVDDRQPRPRRQIPLRTIFSQASQAWRNALA
jgi:hypothetical protein